MPPVILWALGAIGVVAAAKWLIKEARRVNDELDAVKAQSVGEPTGKPQSLERDPQTGVYRPK
jgi:hypothetical protein